MNIHDVATVFTFLFKFILFSGIALFFLFAFLNRYSIRTLIKEAWFARRYRIHVYRSGGGIAINGIPLGERKSIFTTSAEWTYLEARQVAQSMMFMYENQYKEVLTFEIVEEKI